MNNFAIFSLWFFISAGCYSQPSLGNKAPLNTPLKESTDKCEFASYKAITISHFVKNSVRETVKPVYPHEAVKERIQGEVFVRILVSPNGEVVDTCVIKGHSALRTATVEAAEKWLFKSDDERKSHVKAVLVFEFVIRNREKGTLTTSVFIK